MPFSSVSDSVNILINAKLSGQAEINAMAGSVKTLSGFEQDLISTQSKLNDTMKLLVGGITTLNQTINDSGTSTRKASEAMDEWQKRLNAIASNPASSINSPFAMIGRAAQQMAQAMGPAGTAVLATGVAIGSLVGGAIALVDEMAKGSRELLNFSLRLGLSVGQAQNLQFAARLTGVEISTLEQSARLLGAALSDSEGSGRKQTAALKDLGISTRQANGDERELGEVLLDVMQKMSTLTDVAERARLGQVLLGRSSKELIPLIAQYGDTRDAAEKFSESLSTNANATLIETAKQMSALGVEWEILKKNLATEISPIVITIIRSVSTVAGKIAGNIKDSGEGGFWHNIGQTITGTDAHGTSQAQLDERTSFKDLPGLMAALNSGNRDLDSQQHQDRLAGDLVSMGVQARRSHTKEGYESTIATAKSEQARLNAQLTPGSGMGKEAALQAQAQLATVTATRTQAEGALKAMKEAEEAAKKVITDRKEWQHKADEDHARTFVDPNIKTKFAEIEEQHQIALKGTKDPATITSINKDFNSLWTIEYNKQIHTANEETDKLAKKWTELQVESGKFDKEDNWVVNKDGLAVRPDVANDLAKHNKEFISNYIENIRGINRANTSDNLARMGMQANYGAKLSSIQDGPSNEMYSFMKSQNVEKLLAANNRDDSYAQNVGQKDQLEQDHRALLLYQRETDQIDMETALKVAEIKKQQNEDDRKFLGEFFDAWDSGKRGAIGKMFKGQVESIEKTLFTNALQVPLNTIHKSVTSYLTPFELDSKGNANTFGKLLQGTPFGINQASPEIKARQDNTAAIIANTAAQMNKGGGYGNGGENPFVGGSFSQLPFNSLTNSLLGPTASIGGPSIGASANILQKALKAFGITSPSRDTSGTIYSSTGPDTFSPATLNQAFGTAGPNMGSGSSVSYQAPSSGSSSLNKDLSYGAAAIGAISGAIAGFSQHTAQGSEEGVASILGGMSAIPVIGAVAGLASAMVGMVAMFTGQSVAERQAQMSNNVSASFDRLPQSQTEMFDVSGAQSDMTGPGSARTVGVTVIAMDSKSIEDHWQPIANAILRAVNNNHPVRDAVRSAVR